MNKVLHLQNSHNKEVGKRQSVRIFLKHELWLCIGCIILEVTYGKKGYSFGVKTHRNNAGEAAGQIDIDVCGKTYLLKVSSHLYYFNYYYLFHLTMLSYTILSIYWVFL